MKKAPSSGLMTGSVYIANQLVTERSTIVEVEVTIPARSPSKGRTVTLPLFVGTSTKHPTDPFDEQIGYELALGRALRAAGRKLIHDGNEKSRKAGRGRRAQAAEKKPVHTAVALGGELGELGGGELVDTYQRNAQDLLRRLDELKSKLPGRTG